MEDQLDERRPASKQGCCLLETVEKKALPPIEPPKPGKTRNHHDQVEQNTQTEQTEFNVIGAVNNVTDRKHRGNRKDAPNPLTGRISPRKKRIGIRVEPSKKKHHCGLFDGPPAKPDRKQPTGFFHPGLASIQGNTNTFQPTHVGVLRLPQNGRKFMLKETTKYRVDTVHGHRVPVAQELEFAQIQGQKQKWKRRVLSPIKRRVDQSDEQQKRDDSSKVEHGQTYMANGDRDIPIVNSEEVANELEDIPKSENHYSVSNRRYEINLISDPNADDTLVIKENENFEGKLQAEGNLDEEALGITDRKDSSDNKVISGQDGDVEGDDCTTEIKHSDTARGTDKTNPPRSAKIKDSVRKLVESMVSRISPEVSDNAEPNPSLFAPSDESCSDRRQVVSIGIQTDWEEIDNVDHVHRISNSPLKDDCGTCHDIGLTERCMEEEQSTTRTGFWLGTPPIEERQQHGCVESDSTCDKLATENSSGEIHTTDDDDQCSDSVHVTMSKGTMTPTMQGWRSIEDTALQGQESPVTDEPTTPLLNPPEPVASQHILEVQGLGRMSIPLQAHHAVHPGVSDMDGASESVSNSDDHLPGMLIEDSGGDYTPAARTASRVSIFTLGHGDQRMGRSTPLGNIPSPSIGNISSPLRDDENNQNGSRASESQASGVVSSEEGVQESRPSTRTRPQTGDVQELIDNLIAERLNGVPESVTPKKESVTGEESESPPDDAVQLITSTNDELTNHQCDMFGNDIPPSRNLSERRRNEEAPSEDTQRDDAKAETATEESISAVKAEEAVDHVDGENAEYVQEKRTDLELQGAFLAMEDAVSAAKLIIRYLGRTDARLREALHRSGPGDEIVVNCPAAERVAEEAHAFAVRTQSVFMTYFRLAEAEDTFREFVLKEFPGSEKERRQLRRWWTTNQPIIDDITTDENSDVLEGETEP